LTRGDLMKKKTSPQPLHSALLCSTRAAVVVGLAACGNAFAQESDDAQASTPTTTTPGNSAVSEVVVSSTRIVRDGFQAPTPTSVIGAQEIAAKAPTNLADFVNTLPSLQGSKTPRNTISSTSEGNSGINALSLRNLGPNRTLVLLDGQRVAASLLSGLVDVNQFPQSLVSRVDVVTGGASADWGSDAVAGVVNFVLDKEFTGFKQEIQGGATTYGDDASYRVSLSAGSGFLSGRGHILANAEFARNEGISGVPRKWYDGAKLLFNPSYAATNGQPQLLVRANSGFATATPGAIITSGQLAGTYFGPGGTPMQLNYGPVVSNPFMQGGDWQYADFGRSGDLDPRLSRRNLFLRTSFAVSEHVEVFGQLSYGRAESDVNGGSQYNIANISVKSDNAFIPASVASRLNALNITSFTVGSLNQELAKLIESERTSLRPVLGVNGDFDAFGSRWTWDVYGQKGINKSHVEVNTSVTARYNEALDAVRNSNGTIVCRSTLTNLNNGCVPYNIFGTDVNGDAAINYVRGTSWGRTRLTESVVAGNLRGTPFSNWAGAISIATGVEHRREAVSGSNDPLSSSRAYFAGNYTPSFGSYNVTEGYLETVVPLASDKFMARSLDFNGAIRATDYSTSGFVSTWKVGLTYSPIDDVIFRATRSRDIRAPNLAELFQSGQTSTVTIPDPFRGNAVATGFQVTKGNLDLQPESADTTGFGVVLQPRFLPGLKASVDLYDIRIDDAIQTVNAITLVNQCFAGNTVLCAQVTRNSAGAISQVLVQPINLANQLSRGIDFEISYRKDLAAITPSLAGDLTLRLLGTRYVKNRIDNGINAPIDTVGTNSPNGSAQLSLPRWSFTASAAWNNGPLGMMVTARGISAGVYNTSYIECTSGCPASTADHMTIEDNHIPGAVYFDANLDYKLARQTEIFLAVDNLANRPPVRVAYGTSVGGAPLNANPTLYDVIGRTYRLGLRVKM
jgi:outer membrane receptor protein involved in Fe transport